MAHFRKIFTNDPRKKTQPEKSSPSPLVSFHLYCLDGPGSYYAQFVVQLLPVGYLGPWRPSSFAVLTGKKLVPDSGGPIVSVQDS